MDFGTTLFFEKELGWKDSMQKAAKAGFKYVDFDLTEHNDPPYSEEEKFFAEVKKVADDCGIKFSQAHAPYMKGLQSDYSQYESEDFKRRVNDSIRRAAMIGAPYIVAHPFYTYPVDYKSEKIPFCYADTAEENFGHNIKVLSQFKDTLKEYGIKMAVENLNAHDFLGRCSAPAVCSTSKEMNAIIDALGDEFYCVCFDCGHLNVVNSEPIADYIKNIGAKRLKVLHLHDNFGIQNDWFGGLDRHLLPAMGGLDWENLAKALKEINYGGIYSFESSVHGYPETAEILYAYLNKVAHIIFAK